MCTPGSSWNVLVRCRISPDAVYRPSIEQGQLITIIVAEVSEGALLPHTHGCPSITCHYLVVAKL